MKSDTSGTTGETRRQRYERIGAQLDLERASFYSHWRDLADYILPTRALFTLTDTNRGERRNTKILDSTPTFAANTLRSGLMAGVTSPARPWFRLTMPDPDLADYEPVKAWLHAVTQRMSTVFLQSNLYDSLQTLYGDLGTFGTATMMIEESFTDVIHTTVFPIGSYSIAADSRRKVNVFRRELRMTVRQLVDEFGRQENRTIDWSRFSERVKSLWEQGQTETWIDVVHMILPNEQHDARRLQAKYKRFASCYYEKGSTGSGSGNYLVDADKDRYLRESGFDLFPVLCLRWALTGSDVYATDCPGMTCLGDCKQLQKGEQRTLQAIDKQVNPPMVGPSALMTKKASILPGDITYLDVREGQQGFRPAHEVNASIEHLEAKQQQVRSRIDRSYHVDLFRMFANIDREMTATEVAERQSEKLLALGPVLERLNQDGLDPLIDITFDIMLRQGLIPEPPEEIQGTRLRVEYISIMAQAQKAVGITGLERFTAYVGSMAEADPTVFDKVDRDQLIDEYALAIGIPPRCVVPDERVEEIRAARAQQQQAMAAAEQAKPVASAVKDLSQAKIEDETALGQLIRMSQAGQVADTA